MKRPGNQVKHENTDLEEFAEITARIFSFIYQQYIPNICNMFITVMFLYFVLKPFAKHLG
jgi:hypothetical protein